MAGFDRLGMLLVFLLCLLIQNIEGTYFRIVTSCPRDQFSWRQRAWVFNCMERRKVYHCMLTEKNILLELCLESLSIESHMSGCPFVGDVDTENPVIGIPFTACPSNLTSCPQNGHPPYDTDELYLYPSCFVPENKRTVDLFQQTTPWERVFTDKTKSTATNYPELRHCKEAETEQNHIIIIITVVSGLLNFFFMALWILKMRSNTTFSLQDKTDKEIEKNIGLQTEYDSNCFNFILILKFTLWEYLSSHRNGKEGWTEFFEREDLKHSIYHGWKTVPCCKCNEHASQYRLQSISDTSWNILYHQVERICRADHDNCCCKYTANDIQKENVSIAALLCIVECTRIMDGKENHHIQEMRKYTQLLCPFNMTDTKPEILDNFNHLILEFAKCAVLDGDTLDLIKKKQAPFEIQENRVANYNADMNDNNVLAVMKLDEYTLPTFKAMTKSFLETTPHQSNLDQLEAVEEKLRELHFVIVTGAEKEGKTRLCREIMKRSSAEMILKIDPEQVKIDFLYDSRKSVLLYLEDFMGITRYGIYERECLQLYERLTKRSGMHANVDVICCLQDRVKVRALYELGKIRDTEKYVIHLS